ncbi:MAG: major capsid protein [Actinomycetota bacterium]
MTNTPFDDLPAPAETSLFARELTNAEEESNFLAQWFPRLQTRDNRYTVQSLNTQTAQVAAVRAFDARPKQLSRAFGKAGKDGEILPISAEMDMGELTTILERAHASDDLVSQAYDDVATTATSVWNRVRQLQAEAILEGKLTFSDATDPGIVLELDFGDTPGRRGAAGTAWSDPAADAFTDYVNHAEAAAELRNEESSYALFSRAALSAFRKNDEVRTNVGTTLPRASVADVQALLSDEGLPPIRLYNETVAGQRLFPAATVMFMPTSPMGNLVEGTTAEVASGQVPLTGNDRAGVISVVEVETRPTRVITFSNALSFPVCNPDGFYRFETGI